MTWIHSLVPIACVIISSVFLWYIKKSIAKLNHSHDDDLTILKTGLDRDLKEFESHLNRQLRIFSTIFDKEYETYQDLWRKLVIFQQTGSLAFSRMLLDSMKLSGCESDIDNFKKACDELGETTLNNSPFVNKIILKSIYDLLNRNQIKELRLYSIQPDSFEQKHMNRDSALREADEKSKYLVDAVQDIAELIRYRIQSVFDPIIT